MYVYVLNRIAFFIQKHKDISKSFQFASYRDAVINPQWLELQPSVARTTFVLMSRTNFHDLKLVLAIIIEVWHNT